MKITYLTIILIVLLSVENGVPMLLTIASKENHSISGLDELFHQKYNTETSVRVENDVQMVSPLLEKSRKKNFSTCSLKTSLPIGEINILNTDLFNSSKTINPVALESEDKGIKSDRNVRLVFEELASVIKVTPPHESPYAVFLIVTSIDGVDWHCSGTLIAADWVMTAAHCVYSDFRSARFYGGYVDWNNRTDALPKPNGAKISNGKTDKMWKYLQTDPSGGDLSTTSDAKTDACMVRMTGPLQVRFMQYKTVGNISLTDTPKFRNCNLTGFGIHGPRHDRRYTRRTRSVHVQECPCVFIGLMICSEVGEGKDMCYGDWGAGLVCEGSLVGVASRLMKKSTCQVMQVEDKACGDDDTIILFTMTSFEMKSWVDNMFGSIGVYTATTVRTKPTLMTRRPKRTTQETEDHTSEYGDDDRSTSPSIRLHTVLYMCSTGIVLVYKLLVLT